jgi:hypothetical protein
MAVDMAFPGREGCQGAWRRGDDVDDVGPLGIGIPGDEADLLFEVVPHLVVVEHFIAVSPEVEDTGLLGFFVAGPELVGLEVAVRGQGKGLGAPGDVPRIAGGTPVGEALFAEEGDRGGGVDAAGPGEAAAGTLEEVFEKVPCLKRRLDPLPVRNGAGNLVAPAMGGHLEAVVNLREIPEGEFAGDEARMAPAPVRAVRPAVDAAGIAHPAGVEIEGGLRAVAAKEIGKPNVVENTVVPALDDLHRGHGNLHSWFGRAMRPFGKDSGSDSGMQSVAACNPSPHARNVFRGEWRSRPGGRNGFGLACRRRDGA